MAQAEVRTQFQRVAGTTFDTAAQGQLVKGTADSLRFCKIDKNREAKISPGGFLGDLESFDSHRNEVHGSNRFTAVS